jgi:hypothetical protein
LIAHNRYLDKGLAMFTGAFYNKYVPDPQDETPHKILSDPHWFPFFKYCCGATNGVHIPAYALSEHIR